MFNFKPNGTKHNKNEEEKYYVFFFQPPKFHAAQDEMKQEDHL